MRVFIFLSLLAAALAVPRDVNRIVGGEPTTPEQYPYVVNMQYNFFGWYPSCGATLITSRTAVSAAHCYVGDSPTLWRGVVGGAQYSGADGTAHVLSGLRNHENYNSVTMEHDVAIITLRHPVTFSSRVGVANIAGTNYHLPDDTPLNAIGFGRLWVGGPTPSLLQHVEVYQVNQEICTARYAYLKTLPGFQGWPDITPVMLCAGVLDVGGRDACQGDSGGPLVHNGNILVGVTSWGYRCAEAEYPGVNARVSYYSEWIVRHGSS